MQRVRKSWSETELGRFRELNREGRAANKIARVMRRTVGAVQGVRRKQDISGRRHTRSIADSQGY